MKLPVLTHALKSFWFTPISPAPLCLYRILYGLLSFNMGLLWLSDASTWFGNSGILTTNILARWQSEARFDLIAWLNPDNTSLYALLLIYLLATVCLTVGFHTRFAAVIVWLIMISFEHRNPMIITSGDKLMRRIGFLLIFSPLGKMISLDRWLARLHERNENGGSYAPWAQRLIQLQVALLYWHAFTSKLSCPAWINGTAVYYAILNSGHSRLPVPYLIDHLWTIKALTWMVLVIEFSLWSLIWIKPFRYWIILMGILLHLGIDWTTHYHMFSCTMIASYLVFVNPEDLQSIHNRSKALAQKAIATIRRTAIIS